MTQANPLQGYFRQTKIAVKLPSEGKFYPEDFLEFNVGNEVDVKAMTAEDELELKNPDALLNGAAMTGLLKSCVPGIKGNAEQLLTPDVTVLMLAIRFATYGDEIEFTAKCPECETEGEFKRSIRQALDYTEFLDDEYEMKLESDVTLNVRPHTFKTSNKAAMAQFEQAKIMQIVEKEELSEEEKLEQFGHVFKKMVGLNYELVTDSIAKVTTPEGDEVTEKKHINGFMKDQSTKDVEKIRDQIKAINETGVPTSHECVCEDCGNEWTAENIEFDPSRFFG